ncbi:MAG: major intrinsic protein [Candidatus Peregrinibacteria bacterium Greene0416_62]|nr:MAG: major intrinsic protein [Candidatus Peregrinibacteria bacterium Greene0416_62]TSD00144.1 MAG: major intrinsic protein [Candidatus Peregrinibacteria bacterium Greene1014_49]
MQNLRLYTAELLGTFLLTLAVSLSIVMPSGIPTPAIAGLTLMILVYVLGPVSGAHVNPAVTVGLWCIGKMNAKSAIGYIVSQIIGAMLVAPFLTILQIIPVDAGALEGLSIGIAEALGAGLLVAGVCSVVYGKASGGPAGVTVGGSLFLGATIASSVGNGIVNPAVAIGLRSVSLTYLLAPFIGGVIFAELYRYLVKGK